jgi:hypothetical protein
MGTRRDFLRQGSLWLAAGLIMPAALDRLDWQRHRIYALGSSLNRTRITLFGVDGSVLKQIAIPVTYARGSGDTLTTAITDGPTVIMFPGESVMVQDMLMETPFNFGGQEVLAKRRTDINAFLADGNAFTIGWVASALI